MSVSSDSAEQLIKICLDGTEFALRISGTATKNIVAALYAISQEKNKTKGKIRLSNMLKTEKDLKIFSIRKSDMELFAQEAKSYGVLYCALKNKKNKNIDDLVDILVRAEDAPKVNRIITRFNLTTPPDMVNIKKENEREIESKEPLETTVKKEVEGKNVDDYTVDDIFSKPKAKEEKQSPLLEKTEKEPLLENSSTNKNNSVEITKPEQKKSVKKELEEIKQEEKLKESKKSNEITKAKINKKAKSKKKGRGK